MNTASRDQDTLTDVEAGQPEDAGRRVDDRRRRLQLVLAALWLLDAMLQGVDPARQDPARVRQGRPANRTQRDDRAILCPRLAAACRIAMGVTMVYMLIQVL